MLGAIDRSLNAAQKRLVFAAAAIAVGMLAVIGGFDVNDAIAEPPRPRRLIYNSDGGNVFIDKTPPGTPADVYHYVDEVADSQVTTYCICPNYGMPLIYPSRGTEMIGASLEGARWEEAEKQAQLPEHAGGMDRGIAHSRALVASGHDPIGLIVDRAHEKKLEAFITFRLNEVHDVTNADSLMVSQFWRGHPERRVGKPGEGLQGVFKDIIGGNPKYPVSPVVGTWFPGALDFSVPEVRARRLAELRECCERYDIDGLDLDFQRLPIYFRQTEGPQRVETMTAWLREVRQMTREAGMQRGRPILLSARVMARPEQNLAIGLDPFAWARDSLNRGMPLASTASTSTPRATCM